jgi:hypothetical protein
MDSPSGLARSSLSPEQRSRFIRSARKLEQVLGTNAFLLDSTVVSGSVQTSFESGAHPCNLPHENSHSFPLEPPSDIMSSSTPTPFARTRVSHTRRQGSIFDLTEEEVYALGLKETQRMRSQDLPMLSIEELPRPSLESGISSCNSSRSSLHTSDASPLFERPNLSSASSSSSSLAEDHRPDSPLKKRRGANLPSLHIPLPPMPLTAGKLNSLKTPYTPRTASAARTPLTPRTPATPSETEAAERRRRTLLKVTRTLGENVPFDLVLGVIDIKRPRRASVTSPVAVQLPRRNSLLNSTYHTDDSVSYTAESQKTPSTIAPVRTLRSRTKSATRPRVQDVPFEAVTADEASALALLPVFGSSSRQPVSERWIGSWNRPDIFTVQKELRALRWR